MKHVFLILVFFLTFDANAAAQEEGAVGTVNTAGTGAEAPSEPADPPPAEEKKRGPYYKKVQGWLWIEGFAGPTAYDPDTSASAKSPTST